MPGCITHICLEESLLPCNLQSTHWAAGSLLCCSMPWGSVLWAIQHTCEQFVLIRRL